MEDGVGNGALLGMLSEKNPHCDDSEKKTSRYTNCQSKPEQFFDLAVKQVTLG